MSELLKVSFALIGAKEYGILILLLIFIHFMYTQNLRNKYSVGACRGNAIKCKLNIAVSQSHMVKARYDDLINKIHTGFIKDVTEKARSSSVTSIQLRDAISSHKHLIWYSFQPAIDETKRLLRENGIPSDSKKLDDYMEEKNGQINAIVWGRFDSGYSNEVMLLTLTDRKEVQYKMQTNYLQFARGVILTGVEIAKNGGN
jgi:hypothetical protein